MTSHCCIILAAGLSSRMGAFKPLLPVGGQPAIVHLITSLKTAGVDQCIIVTGFKAEAIRSACEGIEGLTFVHNPDYASTGMFESACAGLKLLPENCSRVLLTPADIPLTPPAVIRQLLASRERLVFPSYHMRRGHPAAFDPAFAGQLISYKGRDGLRGAFALLPVKSAYIVTEDPRVLMDMDTPEDYERLLAMEAEK